MDGTEHELVYQWDKVMPFKVTVWDGNVYNAGTLVEAKKLAEDKLGGWMNEDDYLRWFKIHGGATLICYVMDGDDGQQTDAFVTVEEVK
jgi:hypothetical protein